MFLILQTVSFLANCTLTLSSLLTLSSHYRLYSGFSDSSIQGSSLLSAVSPPASGEGSSFYLIRIIVLSYTACLGVVCALAELEVREFPGLGNWGVRGLIYLGVGAVNEEGTMLDEAGGGGGGWEGEMSHVTSWVMAGVGAGYLVGWAMCCKGRRDRAREVWGKKVRRWQRRKRNEGK